MGVLRTEPKLDQELQDLIIIPGGMRTTGCWQFYDWFGTQATFVWVGGTMPCIYFGNPADEIVSWQERMNSYHVRVSSARNLRNLERKITCAKGWLAFWERVTAEFQAAIIGG